MDLPQRTQLPNRTQHPHQNLRRLVLYEGRIKMKAESSARGSPREAKPLIIGILSDRHRIRGKQKRALSKEYVAGTVVTIAGHYSS